VKVKPVSQKGHTPAALTLLAWWTGRAAAQGDRVARWLIFGGPVPPMVPTAMGWGERTWVRPERAERVEAMT